MSADVVRYELDNYYFMPDPHQFISTHFPHESRYQLLETPVTLEEFEQLVPVKSTFYKYGLDLASHTNAIVSVDQQATIVIKCPPLEVWLCIISVFSVQTSSIHRFILQMLLMPCHAGCRHGLIILPSLIVIDISMAKVV